MWSRGFASVLGAATLASFVSAQTFQRLGTCPSLGCVFPPDQTDFLAGQLFDIRLEVHAPVNGSEAYNNGQPDEKFTFCIQKDGGECKGPEEVFGVKAPALERWNFTWFEDLFASQADTPSLVSVAAKAYRAVALYEPGEYTCYLKYYNGRSTVAHWKVREPKTERKAKNVILFIGDGMTQAIVTAARLLGHKSINGRYQSLMQLDQMEELGHQMTHSIDSFITDSANSATALYTGHKSSVNALNVYRDSSKNSFDDPKFETWAELFVRKYGGQVGIVSTAYIADATPAAMCSHTRDRGQYASIVTEYLYGTEFVNSSYAWPTSCKQPAVIFGGGAEQFYPGKGSPNGTDFYQAFRDQGYTTVFNKTQLQASDPSKKHLGIFSVSNLAKWLDRNVYPENLKGLKNSPTGDGTDALDQPGLQDMTLKAIDILQANDKEGKGWIMMSEAASIDKQLHVLDYDRAIGETLELDATVKATLGYLKKLGIDKDTLVVVTADHGHGFDVFGSADTKFLANQTEDRLKRSAVGVYAESGLSGYQVAGENPTNNTVAYGEQGSGFPVRWDPRYAIAAGFGANPDHREAYAVNKTAGLGRVPAVELEKGSEDYYVNPNDQPNGFIVNGTLPVNEAQGVHSLQDVPVYSTGPGASYFRGIYNNIDIFFHLADVLALGQTSKK